MCLLFASLRAVEQPSPWITLFLVLCKITRNQIFTVERLNEVCSLMISVFKLSGQVCPKIKKKYSEFYNLTK